MGETGRGLWQTTWTDTRQGGAICGGRTLLYTCNVPLVGWLCMCVHTACACIFESGFNKDQLGKVPSASYPVKTAMTSRQRHNFLCGWQAVCHLLASAHFCLRLSSLCSHSLPIYFHLPHFSSLPVFILASKWFSQAV